MFFKSRSKARQYAKSASGKVIDHFFTGQDTPERWEVVLGAKGSPQVDKVPTVESEIDYSKTHVIITPKAISITLSDGSQHTVSRNKDEFTKVVQYAMEENYSEMMKYVDIANAVKEFVFGTDIVVRDGSLYYFGEKIESSLSKRIVSEAQVVNGSVSRYINFFRKLYKNPSYKAVQGTYDFLVHNDLTILEDGDVKGYKGVSMTNGVPTASHGVPNFKGCVLEMPRNQVEDDPEKTCSYGLHIGAYEYAKDFGNYLLEVSFSPTDVVSVPTDYDNMKLRACKYEVLTGVESPEGLVYLSIDKNGKELTRLDNSEPQFFK